MRRLASSILLGMLTFSAAVACGKSDAKDAGGSECATNTECPAGTPYCTLAGQCIARGQCETDADCVPDRPFCGEALHTCDICRNDSDCPSAEASVCAPGWESGPYCAACRTGDSSTCPSGTVCVSFTGSQGEGGGCRTPDCDSDPAGNNCSACLNEHADPCLNARGDCSDQYQALIACYVAGDPAWTTADCPVNVVPTIRGCTPEACFDEADALEACIRSCDVALFSCGVR